MNSASPARAARRWLDPSKRTLRYGVIVFALFAVTLLALAYKPELSSVLSSGKTMRAEFTTSYKLRAYDSTVKLAGLEVGQVTEVEPTDEGTVVVTMKVDDEVFGKLGNSPTARIEPRTVLGGRYAIEVKPGGDKGRYDGSLIPASRTSPPVELDRVLEALPRDTRKHLRSLVGELDSTFSGESSDALRDLTERAPDVLRPGTDVLEAVRGTRPGKDLPELVRNLTTVADTLTASDGQLDLIVTSLDRTAAVLAAQRQPLTDTVATLPQTLRSTRAGLEGLDGALDRLTGTATALRPSAPELTKLVRRLEPVLADAKPLMRNLRPLLQDAEPVVLQLVPVSRRGTEVLNTVRGPVLDRVNGPVMDLLLNPWHGTGPYRDSGRGSQADHKFYEELAYMATNVDRASMTQDGNGSTLAFQVGAGTSTLQGIPFTLDNLMKYARAAGGGR